MVGRATLVFMLCVLFLSNGLLCGAAHAQIPGPVFEYKSHLSLWDGRILFLAMTDNGDVYYRTLPITADPPLFSGNFFEGAAVPVIASWDIAHFGNGLNAFMYVILENGDIYRRMMTVAGQDEGVLIFPPIFLGNMWGASPVPTSRSTWGDVKGKYDGDK